LLFGALLIAAQIVAVAWPGEQADVASAHIPTQDTQGKAQQPTAVTATVTRTPVATQTPVATATATQTPTQAPTQTATQAPTQTATAETPLTPTAPTTGQSAPPTGHGAPSTPVALSLLPPPSIVSERTFQLAGTGQPRDRVTVWYRQSQIAQAMIDEQGYWEAEVPTSPLDRAENAFLVGSERSDQPTPFSLTFDPWWLDAQMRLQGELGEGFACAPTVLGMAFDYYHQLDASYPAPSSTEIVAALRAKGFIDGYGADAQMLVNLAISYGYSHSFFYHSWSQAHLRKMLDAGYPIIANVRIDMSTNGYGHSVLVIGLSPDSKRVMVLDPAQGMVELSWARFDASWGSFGPPYRHGTMVKP
jgi:hypothetical protein